MYGIVDVLSQNLYESCVLNLLCDLQPLLKPFKKVVHKMMVYLHVPVGPVNPGVC